MLNFTGKMFVNVNGGELMLSLEFEWLNQTKMSASNIRGEYIAVIGTVNSCP
jgi:hypothetical protein